MNTNQLEGIHQAGEAPWVGTYAGNVQPQYPTAYVPVEAPIYGTYTPVPVVQNNTPTVKKVVVLQKPVVISQQPKKATQSKKLVIAAPKKARTIKVKVPQKVIQGKKLVIAAPKNAGTITVKVPNKGKNPQKIQIKVPQGSKPMTVSIKKVVARHPPGTLPGGYYMTESYCGGSSNSIALLGVAASLLTGTIFGLFGSMICLCPTDKRIVYVEPKTGRKYDLRGYVV